MGLHGAGASPGSRVFVFAIATHCVEEDIDLEIGNDCWLAAGSPDPGGHQGPALPATPPPPLYLLIAELHMQEKKTRTTIATLNVIECVCVCEWCNKKVTMNSFQLKDF